MNLVDTPGTNVILERQQRLTEEFVPRADLVLFVLSADRPLSESEVKIAPKFLALKPSLFLPVTPSLPPLLPSRCPFCGTLGNGVKK